MARSILEKIQQSSLHLLEPLSSEVFYSVCLKEALHLSDGECGSIFLEKNGELARVYSTVPLRFRLTPRVGGNTYKAFKNGKIECISSTTIHKAHPEGNKEFKSYTFIPLIYQKKHLGIITLQSTKVQKYTPEQKNSFKVFGSLAVLALRNIELYEHTQQTLENRDLFMSAASHELKTPLTTIHAYAQIIQKKLSQKSEIEERWVDAILLNSYRLQTMIADLFSMSQMKMGVFTYMFEQLNLRESIAQIVEHNSISFARKIIFKDLLKEKSPMIKGDKDKLALAFNNIIGNAVKYSPAEKPITVSLSKKSNHYLISVTDQGIGISPEDLPHVLEQSFQGQHKKAKGMGLGMYLCNQIIETHLGEIRINSTLGIGTTIGVYFPTAKLAA